MTLVFDAFRQVLPFGTGGRRGPMGYGPNRMNPATVAMTVQGHCNYLRGKLLRRLRRNRPRPRGDPERGGGQRRARVHGQRRGVRVSRPTPPAAGDVLALAGSVRVRNLRRQRHRRLHGRPRGRPGGDQHPGAVVLHRPIGRRGRRQRVGVPQPAGRQRHQGLRRLRQPACRAGGPAAGGHHGAGHRGADRPLRGGPPLGLDPPVAAGPAGRVRRYLRRALRRPLCLPGPRRRSATPRCAAAG